MAEGVIAVGARSAADAVAITSGANLMGAALSVVGWMCVTLRGKIQSPGRNE
ncbi:hypothetical protein GCM10010334_73830 [Streptomyces finlayi]|uniref:Uncharacterized protein n=1 Tax=Streptomyces finlayi TaxID=67296 RepID=A0A919CEE5_9ACTN|nr:hypothetical protein GCM10010334_73830 [Streptomyces finlayi]